MPRCRPLAYLFSNQLPLLPFQEREPGFGGNGKIGAHRAITLSVVVPCYNERDGVAELHRRVSAVCLEQSPSYEIVLVIDGATDGTREAIFELAEKDDHVVAIDLARNYGHQIALSAGLEFCAASASSFSTPTSRIRPNCLAR